MEKSSKYHKYKENDFFCTSISFHPIKKTNSFSLNSKRMKYEKVK